MYCVKERFLDRFCPLFGVCFRHADYNFRELSCHLVSMSFQTVAQSYQCAHFISCSGWSTSGCYGVALQCHPDCSWLLVGDTFCHIHNSFGMFLIIASIFHLICIAVDRHQAICNPLHYSRKITMSVAMIMACACWSLAAVYAYGLLYSKANATGLQDILESFCLGGCFVYFNPLWGMLSSAFCFFFPCTVMVCLYTQIFVVAKQHVRKIGDKNNSLNDRGRGGLIKQSESKAAKTLSIVLGVFIFSWMPFFMQAIIDPLTGFYIDPFLLEVFIWLGYFNSAYNPIIYALFYPSFKKCFHRIVSLKKFSANSSTMNSSIKWHIYTQNDKPFSILQ